MNQHHPFNSLRALLGRWINSHSKKQEEEEEKAAVGIVFNASTRHSHEYEWNWAHEEYENIRGILNCTVLFKTFDHAHVLLKPAIFYLFFHGYGHVY